jgi:hypothetical protein
MLDIYVFALLLQMLSNRPHHCLHACLAVVVVLPLLKLCGIMCCR